MKFCIIYILVQISDFFWTVLARFSMCFFFLIFCRRSTMVTEIFTQNVLQQHDDADHDAEFIELFNFLFGVRLITHGIIGSFVYVYIFKVVDYNSPFCFFLSYLSSNIFLNCIMLVLRQMKKFSEN